MRRIYLLMFVSIICISNNSSVYSCSNNYISRNTSYNYNLNRYNTVTQSDLDDVDMFINDFLLGNTTPTTNYYIPHSGFIKNTSNNNICNRTLSYDTKHDKYNTGKYQTNTYNNKLNSRQIVVSNNGKFNRGITHHNTCKVLQGIKRQYSNITPVKQNINNRVLRQQNKIINTVPNMLHKNQISSHENSVLETNSVLTNSEMKSILTDSEINRLINNNANNDKVLKNTALNNNQQDGMKELEKIFTKDEIEQLFPNYVGDYKTIIINDKPNVSNANKNSVFYNYNSACNNNCKILNNSKNTENKNSDKTKKILTRIVKIPLKNKNVKQSNLTKNNNIKSNNGSFIIHVDTSISDNTCLTDRSGDKIYKRKIHTMKPNKNISKYKIDIRKAIIKNSNNPHKIKLLGKRVLLKQRNANNINTNWEDGITQDDVKIFFRNIKDSNAFENVKMQIYSLLGDAAPSFGDTDKIRLILDVIKYNNSNTNEKHIYNYDNILKQKKNMVIIIKLIII